MSGFLPAFPDGVWLIELAPIHDPTLLVEAAATVFRIASLPGGSPEAALADHLQAKQLIIAHP